MTQRNGTIRRNEALKTTVRKAGTCVKQRRRSAIEKQIDIRMRLQDRRRHHRGDRSFDGAADGFCLAQVRHDAQDVSRLENLSDRHRNRARRHIVDRIEPAFADLLAAAGVVEIDDEIRLARVEVGRRIVEGEVAVLADADERDVDGRGRDLVARPSGRRSRDPARRRAGARVVMPVGPISRSLR